MARMIPPNGPVQNNSIYAEPAVYRALSQLDDNFIVIHSLPWICAAVKSINPTFAPSGEIDFIVLHPDYGILAIEVKGGQFKYDEHQFVYLHNQQSFRPIDQIRRGTFALRKLLLTGGIKITIGYAWVFPDVDMHGKAVPQGMMDTDRRPLYLDYRDLPNLKDQIVRIMQYWQAALRSRPPGQDLIEKVLEILAPSETYTLGWDARIENDNRTWLVLTDQQRRLLKGLIEDDRTIVTGGAGTGKTVLAIALARILASNNKRVLFLTYNNPLSQKIKQQLSGFPYVEILTFHALCGRAEKMVAIYAEPGSRDKEWFDTHAHTALATAVDAKKLPRYDALIIDEGQIFHQEWYETLLKWIPRIHVFADQTQAFSYETRLRNREVERLIDAERVGMLTVNMRSPRQVFERLDAALAGDYDQISVRPFESDTLQEIVTYDVFGDLITTLESLHSEKIPQESIAVLSSPSGIVSLQETGVFERIQGLVGTIASSGKVRGLEYPVVVIFDNSLADAMQLVNGYSRATSRVIALYDIWQLAAQTGAGQQGNHLIDQVVNDPKFSEAIKQPEKYLTEALGWSVQLVISQSPKLYWNESLSAWMIVKQQELLFPDEMWIAHLLYKGNAPVFEISTGFGRVTICRRELKTRSLDEGMLGEYYTTGQCQQCGKLAMRQLSGTSFICTHCDTAKPRQMPVFSPSMERQVEILKNPDSFGRGEKQSLGLHMLAMIAFRKQSLENQELLGPHISGRTNTLAYQPLLVFTGIDILNKTYKGELSNEALKRRYRDWVSELDYLGVEKVLPRCTSYWLMKKWLVKISPGKYRRSGIYAKFKSETTEEEAVDE